jgi:hypothetical protein
LEQRLETMLIFAATEKGRLTMAEIFAGGHLRYQQGAWRDDNGDPVDCVVVVRCRDCAWGIVSARNPLIKWCNKHATHFRDNDFCSYGERKAENG